MGASSDPDRGSTYLRLYHDTDGESPLQLAGPNRTPDWRCICTLYLRGVSIVRWA